MKLHDIFTSKGARRFKIDEKEFTPYVALELNNPKMDKQLKRLVSSSARMDGLLNISFDDYMSVRLTLPSYFEQMINIRDSSFIFKQFITTAILFCL